jgi:hypothetical protein
MEEAAKQSDSQTKPKQELRWDLDRFLKPERHKDETYEEYKTRQKINKMYLKERLKGKLMWTSIDLSQLNKGVSYDKEKYKKALKLYQELSLKEAIKQESNEYCTKAE